MSKQSDLAKGTFSGDLTVDTNTLVVDSVNNRVGVGTASPQRKLQSSAGADDNCILATSVAGNAYIGFADNATTSQTGLSVRMGSAENAMVFQTGGTTERMRIDSSGRVTMPYQPAFLATSTAAANSGASGFQIFGSVKTNIGGHFSAATGRFTAPVSGMYHFSATVLSRNGLYVRLDFAKNSVIQTYTESTQAEENYTFATQTLSIYLSAGDYASVTSGNLTTYGGAYNYFSGHLIG